MSTPATQLGSRAVVNTTLVLAARVVSRLVALVMVIVLARHLGDDGYGRYTTLIAYSALVSVIADLGLSPLYTRETARQPGRLPDYLATLLSGKVLLAAAASVIFAVALAVSGLGGLVAPGAALLVLTTYANLLRNTFYALGRLEFEAIAILAEIAIQAGLILAGGRTGKGVSFFVWAYAASFGFTCLYSLTVITVFRLGRPRLGFDRALFFSWLRLAFPFALGAFLTNLYFRADVPILLAFRPFHEVGWYQFAYKPFESLQFVPLAVQAVVYPLLGVYFRQSRARLGVAYARFFKVLVLLGWPLTVGTFVLAAPVGRLFQLFPESIPSLRILALAIVFLFANSAFTAMLYAVDRQDLFAWATGIAVVVNVSLNLAFIPSYGYLAASAITVVTEAAFSVAGWFFVARTERLPWLRVTWRTLLAGLVMGAVLYPLSRRAIYVSAPVGLVAYSTSLWVLRAVRREELDLVLRGFGLGRPA
ncbi:MAG TPA: flippase [Candidatus Dormibacteraeota bacterium]|nr:flippase [Candidatus Dormibacteraeota bacterium]